MYLQVVTSYHTLFSHTVHRGPRHLSYQKPANNIILQLKFNVFDRDMDWVPNFCVKLHAVHKKINVHVNILSYQFLLYFISNLYRDVFLCVKKRFLFEWQCWSQVPSVWYLEVTAKTILYIPAAECPFTHTAVQIKLFVRHFLIFFGSFSTNTLSQAT